MLLGFTVFFWVIPGLNGFRIDFEGYLPLILMDGAAVDVATQHQAAKEMKSTDFMATTTDWFHADENQTSDDPSDGQQVRREIAIKLDKNRSNPATIVIDADGAPH